MWEIFDEVAGNGEVRTGGGAIIGSSGASSTMFAPGLFIRQ
jgi:hypothetical protein